MRYAAFNTGTEFHLLDHIAPLAEILAMPLITTEETNAQFAQKYYPQVETRLIPDLEFKLAEIAAEFDVLFECKYWGAHLKPLFQSLYQKQMRLVFCPHGQSDKGYLYPALAQFALQDICLLYGPLLKQMLQELAIWPHVSQSTTVGNYRLLFYKKHQAFYDELAAAEIFAKLPKNNRSLLYAPTWNDADRSTSFFTYGPRLIEELPSDWNLLLKLHPLLEQRDPAQFYAIASFIEQKPNALLVCEFPPVYPLLAKADAYLGDFSSVGYDFLFFERPLYFFPSQTRGRLHACGQFLDTQKNLYSQMENSAPLKEQQRALYLHAFGEKVSEEELSERIRTITQPRGAK